MELQHRLVRRTINIAVSKALEDMKSNTRRSIRNLIDLGLLFSKSENQKWFFTAARKVTANPRNPYNSLVRRMISDVDNDTIKKAGLNLGYGSLIYGANKLRKRQEHLGFPIPWLLIFDTSDSSGPAFFRKMEHFIREGQELGIYCSIACPGKKDDIPVICEIAKRFEECLFVFEVPSGLITEKTAESLGKTHNAVVSVRLEDMEFRCQSDLNAFRLLKRNRCLYGLQVNYSEDTAERVATTEFIRTAISLGNLFGVYIAKDGVSDACRDAIYSFVYRERGENGEPLITLEWQRDMQYIGEKILTGEGYMAINFAEKVYCAYIKVKDALTNSLIEILSGIQPCTS